jgi:hypothetical protein
MLVGLVVYGPNDASAAETALPLLKFEAAWLHEKLFDVPAVQVAVWLLLWLIEADAIELVDGWFDECGDTIEVVVGSAAPPDENDSAAETALPLLKFEAAWLHEAPLNVPAVQVAL